MASLNELMAQREALERQIEAAKRSAKEEGLAKVRALMEEYGLSLADLSSRVPKPMKKANGSSKVAAKFRNPETGETWSGRGLKPKWLQVAVGQGRKLEEFAV